MLIPSAANPVPQGVNAPALYGGNVRNISGPPKVNEYVIAAASASIRRMDPVTLSSGQISRATAASAALLGFASIGNVRPELPQFPTMPFDYETVSGISLVSTGIYVAGGGNEFIGQVSYGYTTIRSNRGQTCDLAPAVVAPTPVLTTSGTAGATTRYYTAVPVTLLGEAVGPAGTALTTSNATNSATNYNIITIPYVAGAVWFNVYRGTSNSNGQLIAQVPQTATATGQNTVVNDTGLTAGGAAAIVSTTDNCGWVINPAATSTNVITIRDFITPVGTLCSPTTPVLVTFAVTAADSQWA